jgi:hypothetical protein
MTTKFSDLSLVKKDEIQTIKINDVEIEVKQYLNIAGKSAIVSAAVRGSINEGIVDSILMDAYLHVLIFESYFNIEFTEEESANLLETYDILQTNGIFDQMVAAIPQDEYDYLFNSTLDLAKRVNEYNKSFVSIAGNMLQLVENFKLPGQSE